MLFFLSLTSSVIASDTTFYNNGEIRSIYKRGKYRKVFYENGIVKHKTKYDNLWRRGLVVNYDSLGRKISKGKIVFDSREHGKWCFYENDLLKYKMSYRYGFEKDELYSKNGKRLRCYLIYGLGASRNGTCDSVINSMRVRYVTVAGCVVSRNLLIKTSIHNFFVNISMSINYGIKWREKVDCICGKSVLY